VTDARLATAKSLELTIAHRAKRPGDAGWSKGLFQTIVCRAVVD
jgi:hypothetical protein